MRIITVASVGLETAAVKIEAVPWVGRPFVPWAGSLVDPT
jgi:hypothetical protein